MFNASLARSCRRVLPHIAVLALGMFLGQTIHPTIAADVAGAGFQSVVSTASSPRVSFGVAKTDESLRVTITVAAFGDKFPDPQVTLGVSGAKKVVLRSDAANSQSVKGATQVVFNIPANSLGANKSDWDNLRMAFAVRWPGGVGGGDVERERFRCIDGRATHADLPDDPAGWAPLNLTEFLAAQAERESAIAFRVTQPVDGKLTVVIENADGRRVRNLVSGQAATKGDRDIAWDGRDDEGKVVPPGEYRWRAASHPGITPDFKMSFYNHGNPPWRDGSPGSGWLSDHTDPMVAATAGDRIYLGAILAEAGNMIIQVRPDGTKVADADKPSNVGWGTLFLAADDKFLYALNEGYSGYSDSMKDLGDAKWRCERPLSLLKYDLAGKLVPYRKGGAEKVIAENPYQGQDLRKVRRRIPPAPDNLGGAAIVGGKLYVSLRQENRVIAIDPQSGDTLGEIKIDQPGFLASQGESLIAFSVDALVRIDPAKGTVTPMFKPVLSQSMQYPPGVDDGHCEAKTARVATGLAISAAGDIFVCDNGVDQNIKVFSAAGKFVREVGRKGGRPINGAWNPDGMYQPHGIAIDSTSQLWVTETDTSPRRVSVWDVATGAFRTEYLGPARYGSPGGSFDQADATRWIGGGALWSLDISAGVAKPISTLYHPTKSGQIDGELPNNSYQFVHRDGRTFVTGTGRYNSVYELRPDNTFKLWAICGSLSAVAQYPRWTLPKGIADVEALKPLFGDDDGTGGITGAFKDRVVVNENKLRNFGTLLWVDRNGDDLCSPDEVELAPAGRNIIGPGWGAMNESLELRMLAKIDDVVSIVTMSPKGYLPSGAPDYRLVETLAAAKPLFGLNATSRLMKGDISATTQDHFGRLLINSTPMAAVDAGGQMLWTYPNEWVNVHGSHNAPLPEPGVMQGALWFLGSAKLDQQGDVTIINGNHGRFFVVTSDGLYLDEMFSDVRVTQKRDAYHIGGEPFGGYFGRNEVDGKYYLQSGGTDYRVFQINGLDQLKRSAGKLTVTAEQIAAARQRMEREAAAAQPAKSATVVDATNDAPLGKDPEKWPGTWAVQWGDARRAFPYAQVRIVRQGDRLYLAYRVRDPSPWVNNGSDWTMLFKTGDCVNFEFSTDPAARPDRAAPVAGDRKLTIAPMGKQIAVVLYDYHVAKPAADPKPMSFSSPWRSENIDRVVRLESADISVKKEPGGYVLVASVPLAELGLPATGGAALKGDFGVIYGDDAGAIDLMRSYWCNQATALVSDVPGEIAINPRLWGTLRFGEDRK